MSETQGEEKPSERSAGARLAARRAAKAARKASKRGTGPDVPDEVTQGVADASSWLDEHQKQFWGSAAVISVIVVVFGSFMLSGEKVDGDATANLNEGITTTLAPIGEPPPDDDSTVERFATAEERATRALEQFRNTQRMFPDSTAGLFARLGEATALRALGKADESRKVFAKLVGEDNLPAVLEHQAVEGLAFALEAQKNYADATKQFEALAKIQGGIYKVPADYHRARMAAALGKSDDAVKILKDLVSADADRKDADGPAFESVVETAQLLLQEWGAGPIRATPTAGLPGAAAAPALGGAPAPGGGLTQQMIDSLKQQLQAQGASVDDGKPKLTKEIVDALQQQVADGEGDDVTVTKVAAPPQPAEPAPAKAAKAVPAKPAKAAPAKPAKPAPAKPAKAADDAPAKPKAEMKAPAAKPEPQPEASAAPAPPAQEPKPEPAPAAPPAQEAPAAPEEAP